MSIYPNNYYTNSAITNGSTTLAGYISIDGTGILKN